jgi:signal transduction histidine kinase/ligand-binding sensor domain-containing protein
LSHGRIERVEMRQINPLLVLALILLVVASDRSAGQSVVSSAAAPAHADTSPLHGTNLLTPPPAPTFDGITHTFWTRRDGAPGTVTALAQTKDGYLWVGSLLGLYRFDGLRFSSYAFGPNDRALPSLDISSLSPDLEGGLWVGFRNAAAMHLKADGSSVLYGAESGLAANMLEQIIVRPDGSVYAFGGSKLFRFQGGRWINFGKEHGLGAGGVFSVFFDREENIWIGRDKKLCVLKKGAAEFTEVPASVHYVSSMIQNRNGDIWIGDAWRSVRRLGDDSSRRVLPIEGKALLLLDSKDNLWIAQDDEGLARVPHLSNEGQPRVIEKAGPDDISALRTHAILEDREGNIWVGTDRGLDRYEETAFAHFRSTQLRSFPSLVAADDGSMWINSHGSPLMRVQNGVTTPVGVHVHTGPLAKRRNGDICFVDAITNELQCYGKDASVIHVPIDLRVNRDPPVSMTEDTDGSLLISFQSKQIWRFYRGNWNQVQAPGLPTEDPWGMFSDSHGTLWLGYLDDRIIERKDGVFRTLHVDEGTWSNTLTFSEAAHTIWAAGSNGLSFFDGKLFRRVHAFDPDLLRGISGVVEDQSGNLWLNAGAGVLRVSAGEITHLLGNPKHPVKAEVFDENDGLIAQPTQTKRTPSAVADGHGLLWFAMGGDVVSLDPSRLVRSVVLPSVLIENVLINGKPVLDAPGMPGAVLRTNSSQVNNLEISYIGINLRSPERVFYRYRLVGEDKTWQDAGSRRQAFYTRLSPGSYQFQVSANNGEGWSDLPSPLRIEVSPTFYQTWWFRALCLLSVLGLTWMGLRFRVRYATDQVHAHLSARLAEREQIARELHDTLLQGFQGLMMRFHLATQLIPANQKARAEMEEALDRADLLMVESRDRIRGLRGERISTDSLPHAMAALGEQLGTQSLQSFQIVTEGTARGLNAICYEETYEIAKEALSNVLQHSGALNSRVDLHFDVRYLSVRVIDDGRGIAPELLNGAGHTRHWGIRGMRERAAKLNGELKITSSPSAGTEVTLRVPANIAYCLDGRDRIIHKFYRRWILGRNDRRTSDHSH